jgi:hypothetical protein
MRSGPNARIGVAKDGARLGVARLFRRRDSAVNEAWVWESTCFWNTVSSFLLVAAGAPGVGSSSPLL